ncbi:MAG: aminodeoxychorismate synthase component I [PVC group bacterium]
MSRRTPPREMTPARPDHIKDRAYIQIGGEGRWLLFREPVDVVEADSISGILPALRRIEKLVEGSRLHAAGFISYEAAPAFDSSYQTKAADYFPLLRFGIYDRRREIFLPPSVAKAHPLSWSPSITAGDYRKAIDRIKEHIARGDTYQVNFTFRLTAPFTGNGWELFLQMTGAQGGGYGAFIDAGRYTICSASPELFFRLNGRHVLSRPMKGTAARGRTLAEDSARAEWLRRSEKNRAENLMIVDMIRNDLGRVALTGSVRADDLFRIEQYRTVFQMTSTVEAHSDAPFSAIMAALFPCASVTGAPKTRTMSIIAELEKNPRRVYTGCIGFLSPGRRAQFNVAIRTVLIDRERGSAEYGVGGGIVWDSTADDEYRECRIKARFLTEDRPDFSLLETILWTPEDGYFLLREHLERLRESALYFGFPVTIASVRRLLIARARNRPRQRYRVRLLVNRDGAIACEETIQPEAPAKQAVTLKLAPSPVDSRNPFLYHKTTHRGLYEAAQAGCPGCDDVLLWNERGEITESTVANVVLERNGELVTPPVSSGLLAGTFRGRLIRRGEIREEVISAAKITASSRIYLVNSVRKWMRCRVLT